MRPLAVVPVHLEEHAHLQRIQLQDYDIELEPEMQYQWDVSEILRQDLPIFKEMTGEARKMPEVMKIAEGSIVRIDSKHPKYDGRPCEKDYVRALAYANFWYDAFACVMELIEASPDDRTLRDLGEELLGRCRHPYDRMPLGPCFLLDQRSLNIPWERW